MKILDSKFMQGFIKMANDGYLQGWYERNGGNLSYRLKAGEVEMIRLRHKAGISLPSIIWKRDAWALYKSMVQNS